jgi:hypothetical protein
MEFLLALNSIFVLSPFCVLQLCLPPPPPLVITDIYYLCPTSHSISVQRTSLYVSFSFKIFVILFLQVAFLIHLKSTVFHLCAWPFFHCECLTFFYLICFIFPPEFYKYYISSRYFSYFLLLILLCSKYFTSVHGITVTVFNHTCVLFNSILCIIYTYIPPPSPVLPLYHNIYLFCVHEIYVMVPS